MSDGAALDDEQRGEEKSCAAVGRRLCFRWRLVLGARRGLRCAQLRAVRVEEQCASEWQSADYRTRATVRLGPEEQGRRRAR